MAYLTFDEFMDLKHDNYLNQCLIIVCENLEKDREQIEIIIKKYNYDKDKILIV